jgi:hypothetical protein
MKIKMKKATASSNRKKMAASSMAKTSKEIYWAQRQNS